MDSIEEAHVAIVEVGWNSLLYMSASNKHHFSFSFFNPEKIDNHDSWFLLFGFSLILD